MNCYDPESGQVYRETVVKASSRYSKPWHRRHSQNKPYNVLSAQGSDKLKAMVLRKLVCHADKLEPDAISALPSYTAQQIYTAIRQSGCETFNVFKNFVESGYQERGFKYKTDIITLDKPLVNFCLDAASSKFSWMVDLALVDLYCSQLDLRQLAVLDNLITLVIRYTKPTGEEPFDDGVLSNLAFRSSTDGKLSKLKMIFLSNAAGISSQSLDCISEFSALETFCVVGTRIRSQDISKANANAWFVNEDTTFQRYLKDVDLRGSYEKFMPRLKYSDLIFREIQKRRSTASRGDWTLPSADIRIEPAPRSVERAMKSTLSGVKLFERDSNSRSTSTKASAQATAVETRISLSEKGRSTKKRKLKATKAVLLDDMLEGL